MLEGTVTRRTIGIAILALATTGLSGCGTVNKASDWFKGRGTAHADEAVILGAPDAEDYLRDLYELTAGDSRRQDDIYADAESAAALIPGAGTKLRFGLVLATPGHPNYDPVRAQGILRGVLAESELLTRSEIALATVHLRNAERLVGATNETARLRDESSRAVRAQAQSARQRISSLEDENRRLRSELEEAQQKLEAITTIERSIREQE